MLLYQLFKPYLARPNTADLAPPRHLRSLQLQHAGSSPFHQIAAPTLSSFRSPVPVAEAAGQGIKWDKAELLRQVSLVLGAVVQTSISNSHARLILHDLVYLCVQGVLPEVRRGR